MRSTDPEGGGVGHSEKAVTFLLDNPRRRVCHALRNYREGELMWSDTPEETS